MSRIPCPLIKVSPRTLAQMSDTLPAFGSAVREAVPVAGMTRVQRVLLVALAVDGILVISGIALAPDSFLSVTGTGRVVADLGLLAVIATAAVFGPFALSRLADVGEVCLWTGVAFALVYELDLLLDFEGRSPFGFSPYWFFVAAALFASALAGYRTRRLSRGIAAASWALVIGTAIWSIGMMTTSYAFWQTRSGYSFWLRDGAVADFRRSGATNLWPFILEDIQGAIFFHPLLSLLLGAACGVAGASGSLAARRLWRQTYTRASERLRS